MGILLAMSEYHDSGGTSGAKLPLTPEGADAIQRLGRWMRIVGTIQMALCGMALLILLLGTFGGAMAAGLTGLLIMLLPIVAVVAWLMQGLRTQTAGEQLKNLAEGHDIDYLELAFVRLKAVFVLDIVVGLVLAASGMLS
jgi:hypothetical protein